MGFSNFRDDGSTQQWWPLEVLKPLSENNRRLRPCAWRIHRNMGGERQKFCQAVNNLTQISMVEVLKIELGNEMQYVK